MGHAGQNLQGHKMDEELQADVLERKERGGRDCEGDTLDKTRRPLKALEGICFKACIKILSPSPQVNNSKNLFSVLLFGVLSPSTQINTQRLLLMNECPTHLACF